ncbi:24534_t:CDS:2 [Gigaspora margarita]|uniref:24534_t:CDS:1 n=1 Tax=Gigaspora margarita TaxID=4874 RepID=A0ABN7WD69_GIGMA|nr:24534_t:CDS:2 [Gigaspora margarita]
MLNNQSEKNELPWVLSFYKDFLAYSAPVFILIEGAATTIMIIISRHIVRAMTYESLPSDRIYRDLPIFILCFTRDIFHPWNGHYYRDTDWVCPDFNHCSFKSISAIQKALSLRAFISLVYRTGVVSIAFYSVHEDDEEKSHISQTVLNFITAFTTPVLIAVYTHLLLSHYEYLSGDDSFWRWAGIGVCWVSYLYFVKNENED